MAVVGLVIGTKVNGERREPLFGAALAHLSSVRLIQRSERLPCVQLIRDCGE
jgi:hypothetical protein